MANIFFSWSSADEAQVLPLRDRLLGIGLPLWEYSEAMDPGDYIHGSVAAAINQADLALICFSDASAHAKWIVREAEWCFNALLDADRPLANIVPVWVGPHPADLMPEILAENQIRASDLANADDAALAAFAARLANLLGLKAPLVIPAALFAMTRAQCAALVAQPEALAALGAVCSVAGMAAEALADALLLRYGAAAEDLAPFVAGQPLRESIDGVLRDVNARRLELGRRPVFLRWMQRDLVGQAQRLTDRDQWAAGDSLLVVDAASAFHPTVQQQLAQLPQPRVPQRASLLWLAPYTQHTARLQDALGQIAGSMVQFGDLFRQWCDPKPTRPMSFDAATPNGTQLWLHRTLTDIDEQAGPLPSRVQQMQRSAVQRFDIGGMFRQGRP